MKKNCRRRTSYREARPSLGKESRPFPPSAHPPVGGTETVLVAPARLCGCIMFRACVFSYARKDFHLYFRL